MRRLDYPYTNLRLSPSLRCNFSCEYCTHFEYQKNLIQKRKQEVAPDVWIKHLERINPSRELTVIFGTGEPTLYKGLSDIMNSLKYRTLLYTNASNMALKEMKLIKPRGDLHIYISYHPSGISVENFAENANWIQKTFNVIDFHGVPYRKNEDRLARDKVTLLKHGVELNLSHPLVGWFDGKFNFYGDMASEPRISNRFAGRHNGKTKTVFCKTSANHFSGGSMVYPVGPDGSIYTCWRYLLASSDEGILGNLFDEGFSFDDSSYECSNYGDCGICAWDKHIVDKETGRQLDNDTIDRFYV